MNRENIHTVLAVVGLLSFFTTLISLLAWIWVDAPVYSGRIFATSTMVFILCAWLDKEYEDHEAKVLKEILNNKFKGKSKFQQKLEELKTKNRNRNDIPS